MAAGRKRAPQIGGALVVLFAPSRPCPHLLRRLAAGTAPSDIAGIVSVEETATIQFKLGLAKDGT